MIHVVVICCFYLFFSPIALYTTTTITTTTNLTFPLNFTKYILTPFFFFFFFIIDFHFLLTFPATFIEQVETPYAIVEIRTYIHQKYVRLLVVDIIARRKRGQYGQSFYFTYPNVNGTQDIAFEQPRRYEADRYAEMPLFLLLMISYFLVISI